jgi:hypothetical protein
VYLNVFEPTVAVSALTLIVFELEALSVRPLIVVDELIVPRLLNSVLPIFQEVDAAATGVVRTNMQLDKATTELNTAAVNLFFIDIFIKNDLPVNIQKNNSNLDMFTISTPEKQLKTSPSPHI